VSKKCQTGKRGFHSEEHAKAALTRVQQSGDRRAKMPRRVYQCEHCHRWHFTASTVDPRRPGSPGEPPAPAPKPTRLEQAETDRAALERIILACIADGCGTCMHSAAWGRYKIDRMGRDQTTTEGKPA
jgi:hypothetical protein